MTKSYLADIITSIYYLGVNIMWWNHNHDFCYDVNSFAELLDAGVGLVRATRVLGESGRLRETRKVFTTGAEWMNGGERLANVIGRSRGRLWSRPIIAGFLKMGENGQCLAKALKLLVEYLEAKKDLTRAQFYVFQKITILKAWGILAENNNSIPKSLLLLAEIVEHRGLKKELLALIGSLNSGDPLYQNRYLEHLFGPYVAPLVDLSEESGRLDLCFPHLIAILEKEIH